MRFKRKLIIILILVAVLTVIQYALPAHSRVVNFYDAYIFRPFQSIRNSIFSIIPFSIGDVLYLVAGSALLVVLVKWIYYLWKFRTNRHDLGASLLHTFITICLVYILFILGWGGNYYKPSLTDYWQLNKTAWDRDSTLARFDEHLISKLNETAPGYTQTSFHKIDKKAKHYFKELTDSRTKLHGVKVKASLFGYLMQYLGIQGYYNPWTGEAQVNAYLPTFMLPFVICHEMAHQSGVAAEDDANLLAYALGTAADDINFRYSAYFNLWLYTHSRLKTFDSLKAKELKLQLNPITLAHLDTLKKIRKQYAGELNAYSGAIYDGYLKLHHQKDGIESYNKVAITAWAWEEKKKKDRTVLIKIP